MRRRVSVDVGQCVTNHAGILLILWIRLVYQQIVTTIKFTEFKESGLYVTLSVYPFIDCQLAANF